MKKWILLLVLMGVYGMAYSQNIIIQQNNPQPPQEKVIVKEKRVEVPVYIDRTPKEPQAVCLHGYLYVYPDDLGNFHDYPIDIVHSINRTKAYGRSNWRLPTEDELMVIVQNKDKINGFNAKLYEWYMYRDKEGNVCSKTYGKLPLDSYYYNVRLGVRLVSTDY